MLSVKNLIAPVTNKVHLVTIVLVASLFAWFRLSGGQVYITTSNQNTPPSAKEIKVTPQSGSSSATNKETDTSSTSFKMSEEPVVTKHSDDFLAELDAKDNNNRKPAKSATAKKQEPSTGLDDIERSLGLR